ncbi:menaquinone-dependent protoporphyrinogen oxidase [Rhizomicrobium palustre]|uniref:Menaquinone-dependent protoporphyrinogen oxidase n=1 Tax=Rhizomicrobium palustre TaxID=189966 RepID=A0A846MVC0_9PROT|nr:flavodoxin domain-containing protein [Rhizomicrobium palustre]NIK87414.1 menaquinone-dependent protoporphyrinogen oxidase [Rhizomicrobium palustre]
MHLYYVSHDGQARKIAERIAARLGEKGIQVIARDSSVALPAPGELTGLVVLVAAVRYGKHLPLTDKFLSIYDVSEPKPPLVLLSVNLTARKPEKKSAEGSTYLKKTIAKHALKPVLARAIAGMLDYPRYRWFDKQMIRFIMFLTKGPTDPSLTVEFTDWNEVDALAARIGELQSAPPHA